MAKLAYFRSASLFGALLLTALAPSRLPAGEPAADKSPPAKPPDIDVVAQVREINSDKFPQPPANFRQGHVTPRKLDAAAIKKTEQGFTIKLPSGTPIPTLTVYDGKLYASGGFHSKQFYCFQADTGDLVWAVDLDDDGPTSATAEDGTITFNTESCTLFALDARTGEMLWSWFLGDPLMTTPTIAGGRVFTAYPAAGKWSAAAPAHKRKSDKAVKAPAAQGESPGVAEWSNDETAAAEKRLPPPTHVLACFDLKSGKILWQWWIDSDVMSSPVAVDKGLYVTTFGGTVYRFNQADGAILSARQSRATSAPVVVGNDVFFTRRADDGKSEKVEEALVKSDRTTGKEEHEAVRKSAPHLDVAVQQKSQLDVGGVALDASNGFAAGAPTQANAGVALKNVGKGSVSTLQAFQGSRVLNYGNMNFNSMGDQLYCTDAVSGKQVWSLKLEGDLKKEGGALAAPPAAAGGQVFLATLKGDVLQLEPGKGTLKHRYSVGSALRFQPAIQDGRIYVGTQNGQIVCIDTGDRTLTGWPTWGGNAAHTGIRDQGRK